MVLLVLDVNQAILVAVRFHLAGVLKILIVLLINFVEKDLQSVSVN